MRTFEEIQAKLAELSDFITQADEQIRDGDMVALKGLDDEVAQICEEAVSLPPEQAAMMQPVLAEMIGKLERLSETLKEFQDKLENKDGA